MLSNSMLTAVLLALLCSHAVRCQEPSCTKFSFLEQLLEKVVRMEMKMEGYRSELDTIRQDIETYRKDTIAPTLPTTRTQVAFHAYMLGHNTYKVGDAMIFDTVITNIGDAYNSSTGVFRAPQSGTYFFQETILSGNDAEIWAYLAINNEIKSKLYARGTGGRHGSGSQAMVVSLRPNDEVKVINYYPSGKYYGDMYSTFLGYMLT